MPEYIKVFFADNAVILGSIAAALAIAAFAVALFRGLITPFKTPEKTHLSDETIEKLSTHKTKDGPTLTIPEFIRIRRDMKDDLEQELAGAADAEKDQLRARIAELEGQIDNPEPALKDARARIADLEARLTRESNTLDSDQLSAARAALASGDYTAADTLFAEIEARDALAVQSTARAAFARGEIAEAEVRWPDAATHYARAAGHEPSLQNLFKAREFAHRSGDYPAALRFGEQALDLARAGDDQSTLGKALNDHAALLQATGRFEEAEPLFRQAIKIGEVTLGTDHPAYATRLNNLAGLYASMKRFNEALPLVEQALEILVKALGNEHPDTKNAQQGVAMMRAAAGK